LDLKYSTHELECAEDQNRTTVSLGCFNSICYYLWHFIGLFGDILGSGCGGGYHTLWVVMISQPYLAG